MAFEFYSGPREYVTCAWAASKTITKGGCVRFNAAGYLEPATAASSVLYGINMSADSSSSATAGETKTEIIPFSTGQKWKADTSGNMAISYRGKIVSLANSYTIDEDDTGNVAVFEITGHFGELTDKKALVSPRMDLISASGLE